MIVAVGLAALVVYGVVAWWPERGHFPSDMNDATLKIVRRGSLRAATLAGTVPDPAGEQAVQALARRLGVTVRWESSSATDVLRRLAADSIDVVAHVDRALPLFEHNGLTRPYRVEGPVRLALAVPAGENRLLAEADRAVRSLAGGGGR